MDEKVWQQFYCNDCDGYLRFKLNMALNMRVEVVCPNCGRKHPRSIKNGRIIEAGYDPIKEEILVPMSAYSKKPLHVRMRGYERDGVLIEKESDINKDHPAAECILRERWFELYGG